MPMTPALLKRPAPYTAARILWFLVWVILAYYLALTLWLGIAGLIYPYQLDYGEGIVLWFAQQIAHGHSIYKGLTGFPYASSNYPPVAMLLSALLMPLFGDGYAGGRLLNFAAALVVAGLIYRIVRVETRGSRSAATASAAAALFFIGSPYIYGWVPLFRTDLLGLAFTFAGLYFVWEWERKQRIEPNASAGKTLLIAGAALFLLALYTKQTLFAAPAAACLAVFARNPRLAIAFGAGIGVAGGVLYLAMDATTQGAFTFGLVTSNATVFMPEQLGRLVENFAITFPILIALALWALVRRVRTQFGVLEWYAVVALGASLLAGRVGAWENYFFEAIAIVSVLAGIAIARLLEQRQAWGGLVMPLLLLAQLALMWHDPQVALNLMAADAPANRELATFLAHTPDPIISEDMGALATNGKQVAYYTFQYSMLATSGKWDQSWELNGLRDALFPAVILERGTREDVDHYRRFTRNFVSMLDRYYVKSRVIGKYEVYTPAPALRECSAECGQAIQAIGWNASSDILEPGALSISVVWRAEHAMDKRYTAFVHLYSANDLNRKVAQDDHEPRAGLYPTTAWAAGEMVREVYTLTVPQDLTPSRYVVKVGWYDSDTGDRLPVPGSPDNSTVLTTYEVTK